MSVAGHRLRRWAAAAGAATEALGRWALVTLGLDRPELVPAAGRAVLAFGVFVRWGPAAGAGGAVLAWWLPSLRARRRQARASAEADAAVAELAELLRVAVGGGASPQQAIVISARWAPPAIEAAIREAAALLTAGRPTRDVLARLGRTSPQMAQLCSELALAVRTGAPLAPMLDKVAVTGRRQSRQSAEAAARRLPVVLLFPLTCCILPAFGVLTVGPALATGLLSLRP